jgi:hypothetical protein
MPESPEVVLKEAEAAAKAAGEAAAKAEKAAKRIGTGYFLAAGFLFALVGAVLAFALDENDASLLGVSLQPLGGILFGAGVLLIAGATIGSAGNDGHGDSGSIKTIGGLVAVLGAIVAVTALTIVTLTQLGGENKESIVAVTSSAFGIISAVVGAYLGIKITADTTTKAAGEVKNAAVAEYEVNLARQQVSAMEEKAEEKDPQYAAEVSTAGQRAREEAARTRRARLGDDDF